MYLCIFKGIKVLYQWNIDCDYYKISNKRTTIIIKALTKRLMLMACILHKPFLVVLAICMFQKICVFDRQIESNWSLLKQWTKYSMSINWDYFRPFWNSHVILVHVLCQLTLVLSIAWQFCRRKSYFRKNLWETCMS